MNVQCKIPIGSLFSKDFKLLDLDISTGAPDLRTVKTIPAEGEDVISWGEARRNLNQILESPQVPDRGFLRNVDLGPL